MEQDTQSSEWLQTEETQIYGRDPFAFVLDVVIAKRKDGEVFQAKIKTPGTMPFKVYGVDCIGGVNLTSDLVSLENSPSNARYKLRNLVENKIFESCWPILQLKTPKERLGDLRDAYEGYKMFRDK